MELSDKEKQFLNTMEREPILRIMLNSEEIKIANKLYKMGLIQKGKSDDKQGLVIFYSND
jgi:hypothetical protein